MNENTSKRMKLTGLLPALMLSLMVSVSACAVKSPVPADKTAPAASADDAELVADNHDPLEPVNRGIYKFNQVFDGLLLKPIAHIYLGIVPTPVRHGVTNVLTNLSAPVVFIDSTLQGDQLNMGRTMSRFIINSTVGIAGIFDVATDLGIPKEHKKDFGQTMGVWGAGSGPFIEIPILGPSSARDATGMVADLLADPFTYILTTPETIVLDSARIIDRRADLLPLTDRIERDSLDPYASTRSIYQQHREKVVKNYLNLDTAEVDTGKKK